VKRWVELSLINFKWRQERSNLDDVDYCFIGIDEPDAVKAKEAKRSQVTTNNKKVSREIKAFVAMITKAEKDRHKRIREDHNDDEEDEDRSDFEDGL
jgi:hypothetical protein